MAATIKIGDEQLDYADHLGLDETIRKWRANRVSGVQTSRVPAANVTP
jgi:hypothetical protein